jgi:PAS domain S-box-containing protein
MPYPISMDIRTKLVFAMVAVALGSMLTLGVVMYMSASTALRERHLLQLDGIAESMKDGLEEVASGWRDRVSLVASRTQLRESLRDHNETGNSDSSARIRRILADAVSAVGIIQSLAIYDVRGELVASAGWIRPPGPPEQVDPLGFPPGSGPVYEGVVAHADDSLRVGYAAPLLLDGEVQGALHALLKADALLDLTQNRARIGATGEMLIVLRDSEGADRVLHRVRPGGPRLWERVTLGGAGDPLRLALEGSEVLLSEGVTDDLGNPVWAAIRYIPETGWGIVIKLDAHEGQAPVRAFREQLVRLALSIGAVAILIGAILGLRFAKPIHDLAEVADRIREGTLSARAAVTSEDEVGLLARTFNQMAEELEQQLTLHREFQKYFDLSLDLLSIAGTDGYFKRVNSAFHRTLGWSTEEMLSRPFVDFVHPDDVASTMEEIEKLARGIPTISFANRYRCADGSFKQLVWTAQPESETWMIYAIARDVTEAKRLREAAQEEISSLRRRLDEAGVTPGEPS